jgi:hypothetical protein
MPAPFHADTRRASDGSAAAGAVSGRIARPGAYLTDEVFLYRVVGLVASGVDELVELEDCYQLDVVRVRLRDLRARRLRVVTPAHVEG